MLQGMQQAQCELVESVKILREAQGQGVQPPRAEPDPRTQQERGSAIGNHQSGEQNTTWREQYPKVVMSAEV